MMFRQKRKTKSKKMSYKVLIALGLFLFILSGCSFGDKNEEENHESVENNYTSALIEKNSNIYIFDEDQKYLEGVGDLTRLKEFAALSDDWKNIAFKYVDESDKINIYSMDTEEYRVLEISDINNNQISNISWIDNNIIVELYVNPSMTRYLIYDLVDFKLLNTCEGILIDALDNGKILVYGVNNKGVTSLFVNDTKIYTLETKGEVLLRGKVSQERNEIGFITFNYNKETGEQCECLYTGELIDNELKDVKQVIKPYEITGDIVYEDGELTLSGSDGVYEVNGDKFIKDNSELSEKLITNSQKLKELLKNTFKDENINENLSWQDIGVHNIDWFDR